MLSTCFPRKNRPSQPQPKLYLSHRHPPPVQDRSNSTTGTNINLSTHLKRASLAQSAVPVGRLNSGRPPAGTGRPRARAADDTDMLMHNYPPRKKAPPRPGLYKAYARRESRVPTSAVGGGPAEKEAKGARPAGNSVAARIIFPPAALPRRARYPRARARP